MLAETALAATECTQLRTGAEKNLTTDLIDSFTCALHDVKWIVHDCDVLEVRVVAHGVPEGFEHVHREQLDICRLRLIQGVEPPCKRLLAPSFSNPNRFSGREITDAGDELLSSIVSPAQVLFVDADLMKRHARANSLPTLDRGVLTAPHCCPIQVVQSSHVRDGHRHRLNSQVLLKPPSLMLSLISPSDPLDRTAVAVFAIDPNRRVFDHHGVLSPAEVVPPTRRQALVDTPTRPTTLTAARQPTPCRHQDDRGAAQHARVVRVGNPDTVSSFEVVSHSESVKPKNLCQSTTALSHPMPSFGFPI
jgi:hypothetical protein